MPVKKDGRRSLESPGAPPPSPSQNVGVAHSTPECANGRVPASRILSAALLWACAALVAFAILIANSRPAVAFLVMVGVVTVWVVREAMRP